MKFSTIKLFFIINIEENQPVKSIGQVCEKGGNFFLSPIRYFFRGHTYRPMQDNLLLFRFHHSYSKKEKNLIKTIGMIIAFIPGLLLGSLLKGCSFLSSSIKNKYQTLSFENSLKESQESKSDQFSKILDLGPRMNFNINSYHNLETLDLISLEEIPSDELLVLSDGYCYHVLGETDKKTLEKAFSTIQMQSPYSNIKFTEEDRIHYNQKLEELAKKTKQIQTTLSTNPKEDSLLIQEGLELAQALCFDEGNQCQSSMLALIHFKEKLEDKLPDVLTMKIHRLCFEQGPYRICTIGDLFQAIEKGFNVNEAGILLWETFVKKSSQNHKEIASLVSKLAKQYNL
jgi:hypothetical protein